MANIQNIVSKEIIYLNVQHSFGRNIHICNTYIAEIDISQLHAIIAWRGNAWYLNDQSRNGTLVNNTFVNNSSLKINIKTIIQFGSDETTKWEVLDTNPPTSYLRSIEKGNKIIELSSSHAFPNEEIPDTFIYPTNNGWLIEKNGTIEKMENFNTYTVFEEKFTFVENRVIEDTMDMGFSIDDTYFEFKLSTDEEHIHLNLITKNQTYDLGERVHNYLLLVLARKKFDDHKIDLPESEQGWIDVNHLITELSKELNKEVDIYYLNLNIHRIRKLLLDIKSHGNLFSNTIERRPGEIRFSHPFLKIIKEEKCIAEVSKK